MLRIMTNVENCQMLRIMTNVENCQMLRIMTSEISNASAHARITKSLCDDLCDDLSDDLCREHGRSRQNRL